jgi:DUF4097 and DUF4098 domain-containing protein YvlB
MTVVSRTSVLLCAALFSAAGVATGCSNDHTSRYEHTTVKMHVVAEPVRAIVVKAQSGDIDLTQTSASSFVRETQHYDATRPTFTQQVNDGVLTIKSTCDGAQCEVDLQVAVPAGAQVDVNVASGNVHARKIDVRDAHLRSHSGNISVDLIGHQQRIWAHTDSGNINATAADARAVDARTHSGNVSVDARRNPQRLAARTESGNVAVTAPKGEYAIGASTGSGTLNIDGIARNDRAPKSIDARTTSGNVSLRAG